MAVDTVAWGTGQTAVHEAARQGRVDLLHILLRAHVEQMRKTRAEEAAWLAQQESEQKSNDTPASEDDDDEAMMDAIETDTETTATAVAASAAAPRSLLLPAPLCASAAEQASVVALLETRNAQGRTALLEAARSGSMDAVAWLWGQGADATVHSDSGNTLLMV